MNKYRTVIVIALVAVAVYSMVKSIGAGLSAKRVLAMSITEDIGLGHELSQLARALEQKIEERNNYKIKSIEDPLKLSRVVKSTRRSGVSKAEFIESRKKMRLSCTILSPGRSTAIIKYLGKSYVVKQGDALFNRKVLKIDKKKVVLRHNGQETVLYNRPAPFSEIKYGTRQKLDELEL